MTNGFIHAAMEIASLAFFFGAFALAVIVIGETLTNAHARWMQIRQWQRERDTRMNRRRRNRF
jgi:hypothetical protein